MRPATWLLTLTLLAAPVLSGCIGGGDTQELDPANTSSDDGDQNDTSDDRSDGSNASDQTGGNGTNESNASGNGSASGDQPEGNATEDEPSALWTYDNRTGTVSSTDPFLFPGEAEETFEVENGTLELALNLTADGGELDVCIKQPGADACTEEASTEDGNLSWETDDPAGGSWTVELTHTGLLSSVDYELVIAQLVPAAGTMDGGNQTADGNESGNDTRLP